MTEPDEMSLSDQLASATASIVGLRGDVQAERRTRRVWIALTTLVFVAGFAVNGVLLLQLRGNRVEDCKRGNTSRAAIVQAFDQFVVALAASAPPSPDPAVQAERDARVQSFRVNVAAGLTALAPRDCSSSAVN